jgi:hypothetical protein
MTNNNQDRDLTPVPTDDEGGGNRPLGPIRDALAEATRSIGNDPSLAELIAVRDHAPDLKVVARGEALQRRGETTAARPLTDLRGGDGRGRPSDRRFELRGHRRDLADGYARRRRCQASARPGDAASLRRHDFEMEPMLSVEDAARIRLHRAAFDVGTLVVPPGPPGPAPSDRSQAGSAPANTRAHPNRPYFNDLRRSPLSSKSAKLPRSPGFFALFAPKACEETRALQARLTAEWKPGCRKYLDTITTPPSTWKLPIFTQVGPVRDFNLTATKQRGWTYD